MVFPLELLGIGATIAVAIFVIIFIYLVAKWAIKRTKEISKEFDLGAKELSERQSTYDDIVERINSLKELHKKTVAKGDAKTAKELSQEISRLEKERVKAYKKITEYY
jgi:hypothetical protein